MRAKRSIRIPPQVDHVSGQVNHKPFSLSSSPSPLLSPLSSSFYSLPTILNPNKRSKNTVHSISYHKPLKTSEIIKKKKQNSNVRETLELEVLLARGRSSSSSSSSISFLTLGSFLTGTALGFFFTDSTSSFLTFATFLGTELLLLDSSSFFTGLESSEAISLENQFQSAVGGEFTLELRIPELYVLDVFRTDKLGLAPKEAHVTLFFSTQFSNIWTILEI